MFYTIIVIVILIIFFFSYEIISIKKENGATKRRVDALGSFVFSMEKDIERRFYIGMSRAFLVLVEYTIQTGNACEDINLTLNEIWQNGTLKGTPKEIMKGATLNDMTAFFEKYGKNINLNVSIKQKDFYVYQNEPWKIKAAIILEINVSDISEIAKWDSTKEFITEIQVEGLEDPLYMIKSNGLISNKIKKSEKEAFVDEMDVRGLMEHLSKMEYIHSSLAPSFLDRLQGKTTPSPYGIESLVNLEKIPKELIKKDISVVDYMYLTENYTKSFKIKGMPSWFQLDENHLEVYNVSHLIIN